MQLRDAISAACDWGRHQLAELIDETNVDNVILKDRYGR